MEETALRLNVRRLLRCGFRIKSTDMIVTMTAMVITPSQC
ncbi:hypothetical protein PPTG_24933 [Phytophthora nicotianae INRA-310]|uniref:Uncharacterized protein n=1 Tax=Phytophthora nicotianae (strain INRA-310) TaxID=761204 RepID=W2PBX2_PHYN3|nr:hypothetical protein PPTG_24933 [Phytophthora nicotianae INRA-310]ETM97494.1 hypothetical protein PPTG_24933 [Phytophthora nicotianae INRA-310]